MPSGSPRAPVVPEHERLLRVLAGDPRQVSFGTLAPDAAAKRSVALTGVFEMTHRVSVSLEQLGQAAEDAVNRAVAADAAAGGNRTASIGRQPLVKGGGNGRAADRPALDVLPDVVGVGFATGVQALRVVRIPAEIPGLVSIADGQPRVRRLLENRIGRPAADVTLVTANALSQALGQGPLGLVVDIAHRSGMVGEFAALGSPHGTGASPRSWTRAREPPPSRADRRAAPDAVAGGAGGAVRGSRRASARSGRSSATLAVTRNPRRASDLLLVGIPKAATLGREAFAAQFDRGLSRHGVVTMDASVLRRLDRVDVLVLGADVAVSDGWSIDEVVPFADHEDVVECTVRARSLFDIKDPRRVRTRGAWTLAPLDDSRPLPRGAINRSRLIAMGGRRVLALWRGDDLSRARRGARGARRARRRGREGRAGGRPRGVPRGGTDAFARRLNIDGRLTAGRLAQSIRTLQAQDHVTLLVTGDDAAALRAADVGIGVEVPGAGVPFGADLLGGAGLANAWRVIDAVPTAREVSRRSALFALGGASTGAVWASMGPGALPRAGR